MKVSCNAIVKNETTEYDITEETESLKLKRDVKLEETLLHDPIFNNYDHLKESELNVKYKGQESEISKVTLKSYFTELSQKLNDNTDVDEKIDITEIHFEQSECKETKFTLKNEIIDIQRDASSLKTIPKNPTIKPYQCTFCPESFETNLILCEHTLKQHSIKVQNNAKKIIRNKSYTCNKYLFKAIHKPTLTTHLSVVHNESKPKLKCQFCNNIFVRKLTLDDHMIQQHKDLIKHNLKTHITSKVHKCTLCPYESTYTTSLNNHRRAIHNELQIKCDLCWKTFLKQNSFHNHLLRTHKSLIKHDINAYITSKIHKCSSCNFETTNKTNLVRHFNAMHNEDKSKVRVKCEFCDRTFGKKYTLKEHMEKHYRDCNR